MLNYIINLNNAKVVLCVCRKDDSGQDGVFPSLLLQAKRFNIPFIKSESINSNNVLKIVEKSDPDIALSLQNNMIFGSNWLDFFNKKLGIVNVHYAPLPKYGGYWPEMWAIWNGETRFAVSMHYVEKGLDTGPIIDQYWFDIDPYENRETLYKKSSNYCYEMLTHNLNKVLNKRQKCQLQDKSKRTYYPKSLPNDGVLDLSWSVDKQERFIRAIAFTGFPGPKIKIENQFYTILMGDIPFFEQQS